MRTIPRKKTFFSVSIFLLVLLALTLPVHPGRTRAERPNAHPGKFKLGSGAKRITTPSAPQHVEMPHLLAASYYSLNGGLNATLMLSNQGPRSMSIGVNLFSLTGARLTAPTITLEGNTFRGFDLNEWAIAGGPDFREGSLQVAYTGGDMELGGVVKLVDADRSLIFDEELAEPMMFASSRLEGVWWLPSHKTEMLLAVSNTTDAPLSVNINVDGVSPKQKESKVLTLGSHETRVMRVQDFAENGRGTLSKIGGISINHSGSPGALLARGLIEEPETGYSSVLEFSDPQSAKSSRLDGAGLRIGKISGEQLTQAAVARNVGDSSSVITGRIAYAMSNGSTSEVSLPQVHLAPGEVREVNLAEAIKASGLRSVAAAGLQLEYSGQPGSVIMSAQSVSSSGNQVFRVLMIDPEAQHSSTGGYPWSLEGSSSTVVYIKSVTELPQQYRLEIDYAGGAYAPGLTTVAPGQTVALDVRALRDNQVPDQEGRKIPLEAVQGQIFWSVDGDENLVLIGRAEQVDALKGMSMTSSCQLCCPNTCDSGWIIPGSVSGVPGDTSQFTAVQQNRNCYGTLLTPFTVTTSGWSSSNPAVATVNSSGLATAQGAGSTNIQASWSVTFWDPDPSECSSPDPPPGCRGLCLRTSGTLSPLAICDVRPRISGPTSVWWFNGQTPFGYATQITLTTSCTGSSWQWTVGSGASKVSLGSNGNCSITVQSAAASATQGDVSITVTVSGQTSDAYHITVLAPNRLVQTSTTHSADGTWGYLTEITYSIRDQFNTLLPAGQIPVNEHWTTPVVDDYPGNNWFQATEGGRVLNNPVLSDVITGQRFSQTPTPRSPQSPLGTTRVHHWGQDIFVGSTTVGAGRRVQSNTQQKYTDHAAHENITSPNPN